MASTSTNMRKLTREELISAWADALRERRHLAERVAELETALAAAEARVVRRWLHARIAHHKARSNDIALPLALRNIAGQHCSALHWCIRELDESGLQQEAGDE